MTQPNDAQRINQQLASRLGAIKAPSISDTQESWEKEQYAAVYSYLQPLVKEDRFQYDEVGRRTGFREKRVQDALTFRLNPSPKQTQLFGQRVGSCYLCTGSILTQGDQEPLCLKCLNIIEAACLEIAEDEALLILQQNPEEAANPEDMAAKPDDEALQPTENEPMGEAPAEAPLSSGEMVPIEQLWAMQEQLSQYKERFGELSSATENSQSSATAALTPAGAALPQPDSTSEAEKSITEVKPTANPSIAEETEQLLSLLDMDDRELAAEANDLATLVATILPNNKSSYRHFGFLRAQAHKP